MFPIIENESVQLFSNILAQITCAVILIQINGNKGIIRYLQDSLLLTLELQQLWASQDENQRCVRTSISTCLSKYLVGNNRIVNKNQTNATRW